MQVLLAAGFCFSYWVGCKTINIWVWQLFCIFSI